MGLLTTSEHVGGVNHSGLRNILSKNPCGEVGGLAAAEAVGGATYHIYSIYTTPPTQGGSDAPP